MPTLKGPKLVAEHVAKTSEKKNGSMKDVSVKEMKKGGALKKAVVRNSVDLAAKETLLQMLETKGLKYALMYATKEEKAFLMKKAGQK